MKAVCKCGSRQYASQAEADAVETDGFHKCPSCHTFATDHWYLPTDEGRCGECDARSGSHR